MEYTIYYHKNKGHDERIDCDENNFYTILRDITLNAKEGETITVMLSVGDKLELYTYLDV